MFAFVDLETTGLNPDDGYIIEVALIITDDDLNVQASMTEVVDWGKYMDAHLPVIAPEMKPSEWLKSQAQNDIVLEMHEVSGLWNLLDDVDMSLEEIDSEMALLCQEFRVDNTVPLAGSSIGSLDRPYIDKHLPLFSGAISYRNVDVSTLKELCRRWNPDLFARWIPDEKKSHRAMADCRESIKELQFYRDNFLFLPEVPE